MPVFFITPSDKNNKIGFVETAGFGDFAYIVWEEGEGNVDEGMKESASIVVVIIYLDGKISRLERK